MRNIKNIILILVLILITINIVTVNSYALDGVNPGDYEPGEIQDTDEFVDYISKILGVFRTLGIVISVIALMAIGIKYMLGSAEEKASYKETMIPYLIGAIMVFVIPTIVQIIYDLVTGIGKTTLIGM